MITECWSVAFGISSFSLFRMDLAKNWGNQVTLFKKDLTSISTEKWMNSAFPCAQNSVSFHFLRTSCMSFGRSVPYAVVQCLCHVRTSEYTVCIYPVYPKPCPLCYWKRREGQNGRNDHTGCVRDTCRTPGTFSHRCYRRFPRRIFLGARSWSMLSPVAHSPSESPKLPRDLFRRQSRSGTLHTRLQNFCLTQKI